MLGEQRAQVLDGELLPGDDGLFAGELRGGHAVGEVRGALLRVGPLGLDPLAPSVSSAASSRIRSARRSCACR
jgi:hypothetical protein